MSSISAGTSSGTALVQSGDTTGALVIKTGGSAATAATFNADQTVTLAAPLPVGSGGTGATTLSGITVGTATSATTATNLAGGSAGTVPYQSASGTTQMLAAGTSGYLLQSNGAAAPSWTPAPASAGTVTAVASGSLADGTKVILNSDGTVSAVTGSIGSSITTLASASSNQSSATQGGGSYDVAANSVFFAWRGTSNYLYGIAGVISGSTITFGTPVTIDTNGLTSNANFSPQVVYCSVQNCHAILYSPLIGSQYVAFAMVTVSGSTVTVKQVSQFNYGNGNFAITYDSIQGQVFLTYTNPTTGVTQGSVGTINNTSKSMTLGGTATIDASGYSNTAAACFDSSTGNIYYAYTGSSNWVYCRVITIASSAWTSGADYTATNYAPSDYMGIGAYFSGGKFILCVNNSSNLSVRVGTVSGTAISFGTLTGSGLSASGYGRYAVFSFPGSGTFIGSSNYVQQVTVSGSTPSFGSTIAFGNSFFPTWFVNGSLQIINTSYNSGTLYAYVGSIISSNLTATNFLGISNAAYTNGQTATIQTVGSVDDAQSGLTPGLKYYVSGTGGLDSAAITQPYAGLALTSTKLVIKG